MNKIYLPFFTIAISLALLTGCTGEKKGSVVEKATEAAESVAENVAKAAETVKEKAPEAAAAVKEATTEAVKKTTETAEAIKEAAPEKIAAAKKTVTTAAVAVKEKAAEAVSGAAAVTTTPEPTEAKAAASPETVRLGGSIFKRKCVACHGIGGKGSAMAPGFVGNEWVKSTDVASISAVITGGRTGAAKKYKKFPIPMPAHASMKSEEVSALAHYIKSIN